MTVKEFTIPQPNAQASGFHLLTVEQAASILGISKRKLFDLTVSHRIRCVRIDRLVRYRHSDLEAFAEACAP